MSKSDLAISVRGISKAYKITPVQERHSTLVETLGHRLSTALRKSEQETFWALRDLSFDVRQGEVVGIIGRNGAGKSTLLKILSRITEPTTGEVDLYGRIGSLLEVGTGFHPELTGRENVYLNGQILGMRRKEIDNQFDAIVNFAEIEKFIDTPVKRYSSGMYVRLAFAVAAHLEPEILIIDEVLAVGDVEFQKKCLGKMGEVAKQGRTVLFVSHNMGAISSLCTKGVCLQQGRVAYQGTAAGAIRQYTSDPLQVEGTEWTGTAGDENLLLERTWVRPQGGQFDTGQDLEVGFTAVVKRQIDGLIAGFTLSSQFGYELAYVLFDDAQPPPSTPVPAGTFTRRFRIPANTLAPGTYQIQFDFGIHMVKKIISDEGELTFTMENVTGIGRRFILPSGRGRSSFFRPAGWIVSGGRPIERIL